MAWMWPIWVAAWLVPAGRRAEWRCRWAANLTHCRVLIERGELPERTAAAFLRGLFNDAIYERFGPLRVYRFLRGPVFPVALEIAALVAIVLASRGLTSCRYLIGLARDIHLHPDLGFRYDLRGDRLFEYLVPCLTAAGVGAALLLVQRRSLRSLGWRSWALLSFQVSAMFCAGSLLWIEGGRALRSVIVREGFRFGVAGIGLAVALVVFFGGAVRWCIADQRRRCPVCLHRLIMPVTIGSWASVFDPAATELMCEEGHGSLAMVEAEVEISAPDRWIQLDASWSHLFSKPPAK